MDYSLVKKKIQINSQRVLVSFIQSTNIFEMPCTCSAMFQALEIEQRKTKAANKIHSPRPSPCLHRAYVLMDVGQAISESYIPDDKHYEEK